MQNRKFHNASYLLWLLLSHLAFAYVTPRLDGRISPGKQGGPREIVQTKARGHDARIKASATEGAPAKDAEGSRPRDPGMTLDSSERLSSTRLSI